jgi:hypothetical protein
MRVELTISGGLAHFPQRQRALVVESDQLPADIAADLLRLVEAAHFFDLLPTASARPGARDTRCYTLTVQGPNQEHSVRRPDPLEDPALVALVAFVRHHGHG